MTTPPHGPEPEHPDEPVSLHKPPVGEQPASFDPYRFGAPEHPVPPEYAPPGYRPPPMHQPPQYGPLPPPPQWSQYPPPRGGNGKAIAALVLGIGSIVFCWLSVLDAALVIPALILGVLALNEAKRRPHGEGRRMAQTGIALAVVGAVLATALTVYIAREFRDCLHLQVGSSEYKQCIRDHLP